MSDYIDDALDAAFKKVFGKPIPLPPGGPKKGEWSDQEVEDLRTLHRLNRTPAEISDALNRERHNVLQKAHYIGLGWRGRYEIDGEPS